ncbi:MAG: hypothetical protein FWG78_00165 [Coriobacteriia bacterium]|nr:hypothetical protein [Coriobacteriia bacterium]
MAISDEARSVLGDRGWRLLLRTIVGGLIFWVLAYSAYHSLRFLPLEAYYQLLEYFSVDNPKIVEDAIFWLQSGTGDVFLGALSILAGAVVGVSYRGGILKYGAGVYWAWPIIIIAFIGIGYWAFVLMVAGLLMVLIAGILLWTLRRKRRRVLVPEKGEDKDKAGFVAPDKAFGFWAQGIWYFLKVPFELFGLIWGTVQDAFWEPDFDRQDEIHKREMERLESL